MTFCSENVVGVIVMYEVLFIKQQVKILETINVRESAAWCTPLSNLECF